MDAKEFYSLRQKFQKTQKQMSRILGTSLKAIQSFEQGWRKIPLPVERQMLFLLAAKNAKTGGARPCWEVRQCQPEIRTSCPAWEFSIGNLCWFVNGTLCRGEPQETWGQKMKICRKCEVFSYNLRL